MQSSHSIPAARLHMEAGPGECDIQKVAQVWKDKRRKSSDHSVFYRSLRDRTVQERPDRISEHMGEQDVKHCKNRVPHQPGSGHRHLLLAAAAPDGQRKERNQKQVQNTYDHIHFRSPFLESLFSQNILFPRIPFCPGYPFLQNILLSRISFSSEL